MPDYHYAPGTEVSVEVVADTNGDVATDGDAVAVTGEGPDGPEVELVNSVDQRAIGVLKNTPEYLREETNVAGDLSAGDSAGRGTLILGVHIVWLATASGYTAAPNDYVEVVDGGVVDKFTGPTAASGGVTNTLGVDGSGQLETNAGSDVDVDFTADAFPFGRVFTTIAREWGVGDRVAVALTGGN